MADPALPEALHDEVRTAWQRYVDLLAPFRPDLHRYCRRLTGNVWDAEDLVQETLLRAFAKLGIQHPAVERPRAYLLRTASHAWIDTVRRRSREAAPLEESPDPTSSTDPAAVRDAGTALLRHLSPQERAAVVLKDVFELSLDETAEVLETTVGAVKSALHRGRSRLADAPHSAHGPDAHASEPSGRPVPPVALVDRFVEAYNAADLPGLVSLLLDHASVEQLGTARSSGRKVIEEGFLAKAVGGHPEWPEALQYESARLERAWLDGEPLALGLVVRRGAEALEQVMRFEAHEGRILRIRTYAFCPEVMRELGERLGRPVRTGLYRYPTPAPGEFYA